MRVKLPTKNSPAASPLGELMAKHRTQKSCVSCSWNLENDTTHG